MSAVSYIQINIFAIILLCILLFHFRRGSADKFLPDQRIFEWMLLSNIIILVLDVGTGIIDGKDFITVADERMYQDKKRKRS